MTSGFTLGAVSSNMCLTTNYTLNGARTPLADHVSVVVFTGTRKDVRFLFFLPPDKNHVFWTPNARVTIEPGTGWIKVAEKILSEIGVESTAQTPEVVRISRTWIPSVPGGQVVSHVVVAAKLSDNEVSQLKLSSHLKWMPLSEVTQKWTSCWGTSSPNTPSIGQSLAVKAAQEELIQIVQAIAENSGRIPTPQFSELPPSAYYVGLGKESARLPLVESAHFGEFEQELLFREFLTRTFPYPKLKKPAYVQFLIEWGWPKEHMNALFRSADAHGCSALSFRDFVVAVAATAPSTQHGGPCGEARCRYIFRFYDSNSDGVLEFPEFISMVGDIHRLKNLSVVPEDVEKDARVSFTVFESEHPENLSLSEFLYGVGQLKFRGTSVLLRAPKSVIEHLRNVHSNADMYIERALDMQHMPAHLARMATAGDDIAAARCRRSRFNGSPGEAGEGSDCYELATHSVKVRRSGTLVNVTTLWDFQGTDTIVETAAEHLGFNRMSSVDTFNIQSVPNGLLNALKYFESPTASNPHGPGLTYSASATCLNQERGPKAVAKSRYSWGMFDRVRLARSIIGIANDVKQIFMLEPRMVQVRSPAYVLGDIHGNFHDLLSFEKVLWRLGPTLTPANIIFLGDYVDRGQYGVEVIAYLFSQKVLAPTKFHLLRGNHELRAVQKMFHFHSQCLALFNETLGEEVWEAINEAFDVMPLSALIDDKILCVHGGIFPADLGGGHIESINKIPSPLRDPEKESPLAWEILWNDPAHENGQGANGDLAMALKSNNGFAFNSRRGTAHIFSYGALQAFLERNKLSHVIRAHEVQQAGFQLHQQGRLLTVFSSSQYCGYTNEAACILAENYRLRIIRLDTN